MAKAGGSETLSRWLSSLATTARERGVGALGQSIGFSLTEGGRLELALQFAELRGKTALQTDIRRKLQAHRDSRSLALGALKNVLFSNTLMGILSLGASFALGGSGFFTLYGMGNILEGTLVELELPRAALSGYGVRRAYQHAMRPHKYAARIGAWEDISGATGILPNTLVGRLA